ncbi:MAG: copper amine oxidase N-terminal domain-containing protein [Defluviitaleaceae bacterium]|nr:copper amine oxidase N-terminal domain-containing protein [Defluviitaleaceae bacterium]
MKTRFLKLLSVLMVLTLLAPITFVNTVTAASYDPYGPAISDVATGEVIIRVTEVNSTSARLDVSLNTQGDASPLSASGSINGIRFNRELNGNRSFTVNIPNLSPGLTINIEVLVEFTSFSRGPFVVDERESYTHMPDVAILPLESPYDPYGPAIFPLEPPYDPYDPAIFPLEPPYDPYGPAIFPLEPPYDPYGPAILPPESHIPSPVTLRFVVGSTTYSINGVPVQIEAAPFIDTAYNRTMMPLRVVAEALGATVDWNGATRTITINQYTTLSIGVALPDGMGAPVIVNDRTFVPIRYVAEILSADVEWDGTNRAIYIHI